MSTKTWDETKALLDDPHVSADTKQAVLSAYALNGDGNPAAADYFDQYNVYPYIGGPMTWVDPDTVYDAAREESESAGYVDRQYQDRLENNQSALDNAQAPGSGSGAIANSDELFDLAKDALRVFEEFVPIDEGVPGECRHIDGPLNIQDIQKRFDEQRGIDFAKFLDEAQRLRDAHATLTELHDTTESNLNALYKDWTGTGANASYQKYSGDIAPNTQELLEYLEDGAEVIEATVQTIYEACNHKADEVIALYSPTVGSAVPDTARKVMKLARGEFDSQDEILEVAAWVDSVTGSNIESTIRDDECDLNDENKTYTIQQCQTWIRNSWNTDLYDNLYGKFTAACDDTKEAVDTAWEELNNYLKEYTSGFPEGGDDGTVPPPANIPGPSVQDPGGSPGPAPGPGPGGSGPGLGGGGSGGGGTPSVPGIEQPDTDEPQEGKNPITGDDLDINPETGEPYPIDPETGEPIKDLGDDQDTLVVEKGDHRFEMTEPDDDGRMEISVDGGSGEPKEYQLDFGDGELDDQTGDFGPEGAGHGADDIYRPGPDGKIYIEDGDLKMTAERPEGPDGPTKVTVDDGTPPPTTYTLGEVRQENSGLGPAGGGMPREQFRTMPAPGENPFTADAWPAAETPTGETGAGAAAAPEVGSPVGDGAGESVETAPQNAAGGTGATGGGGGGEAFNAGAQSGVPESVSSGTGLGSAPGGLGEQMAPTAAGAGAAGGQGGMGMMGGMGAMGGAGGGQGGDQERSSNPYRIDGAIFDTTSGGQRISGSLDDDGDRSIRFDR